MLLPFSSAEDKTSVGGDEFMEKIGTGWSGHIVELDPVAIAAESSARQTLSLIMVSFSSAEEKTRVGNDEFPERNEIEWSGRIVELDPVAVPTKFSARWILSIMMLPLSSTEDKTSVGDDGLPEKNGTGWSGHIVELDLVAVSRGILSETDPVPREVAVLSAEEKT